ncbi:hypothetical protein F5Y02DRAFT_401512 [Annulohypoxylon stygium]|nr:hypothetical protein F5Y02DRAFT_401512 [Annulohypoxylon stygium]
MTGRRSSEINIRIANNRVKFDLRSHSTCRFRLSSVNRNSITLKYNSIYALTPENSPIMSKNAYNQVDDKSSAELPREAPTGQVYDGSYTTKGRNDGAGIPVLKDDERIEDPINTQNADSDQQLARDDAEAIDQSNVLKERTRGKKPGGTYREPTDEQMGLTEE